MTYVRDIDRKIEVQTEESFQKTIMDEIKNLKKALEQKIVGCSLCVLFNCLYYEKDG